MTFDIYTPKLLKTLKWGLNEMYMDNAYMHAEEGNEWRITKTKINKIIVQVSENGVKKCIWKNTYYAEQTISPLSSLKFQVLLMLVSTVAHATCPWFTSSHGNGSAEVDCVLWIGVEIRYLCSALRLVRGDSAPSYNSVMKWGRHLW
jgi:hypothetical protein